MKNSEDFEFEILLTEKIIKSLETEPEKWITSIMGLMRITDNLELNVNLYSDTEIHKPYKYSFKHRKLLKELNKVSRNLFKIRRQEQLIKLVNQETANKSKLAEFFNINSRSNKLKKLEKLDNNQTFLERFFKLKR